MKTASAEPSSVSGKLHYPENFSLPADAIVTVSLTDVSPFQDSDATLIDWQILATDQRPMSFDLAYDPAEISDRNLYAIQARVTSSGRVILTNASAYLVITQSHPTRVEVYVEPRN
ncbi:MAG: YbaY family lipoprotein [Phormidesmis sp.]